MYTKKKRKMRGGDVKPSEMSHTDKWYNTLKNAIHQEYGGGGGVRKSRRRKKRRNMKGGAEWPNTTCSKRMDYGDAVKLMNNAPTKSIIVEAGACEAQANYIDSLATSIGNPSDTQVGAGRGKRHRKNGNNKRKTRKKHKKKYKKIKRINKSRKK